MRTLPVVAAAAMLLVFPPLGGSQTRLEFEVASIRPSNMQSAQVSAGVRADGAQIRYTFVPLINYVGYAYDVRGYQIIGPDWLKSSFFDMVAKLPDGVNKDKIPQMLRTLLIQRFGMMAHRENREFPVYALELAKGGLRMKALESNSEIDDKGFFNFSIQTDRNGGTFGLGGGAYFSMGEKGFEGKKLSTTVLASMLTPFFDHPVIDMTGLSGVYDFVLDVSPEDRMALMTRSAVNAGVPLPPQALRVLDTASGDSLNEALQKLGLTLTSSKAALDVVVVDAMQRTPTEN